MSGFSVYTGLKIGLISSYVLAQRAGEQHIYGYIPRQQEILILLRHNYVYRSRSVKFSFVW